MPSPSPSKSSVQSAPSVQSAIGVDIGGTKMHAAWVDIPEYPKTPSFENFNQVHTPTETQEFVRTLVGLVQGLCEETAKKSNNRPVGIGISTAGIVDPNRGEILGATGNLPAIKPPFNIRGAIQEHLDLPVTVLNDANAAAFGEYRAGAAKGFHNVLMVTLGTGVGTGIIIDRKIVQGAHFSAGEGGHICIALGQNRSCTCGKVDCWEAYASGTGLKFSVQRKLAAQLDNPYAQAILGDESLDTVTTHLVINAMQAGNPLAKELLEEWHLHVATGLGSLINVLDPDVVVIGGGMAQFVDFTRLRELLEDRVMQSFAGSVRLVSATLGNKAGMIGAAYLALDNFV